MIITTIGTIQVATLNVLVWEIVPMRGIEFELIWMEVGTQQVREVVLMATLTLVDTVQLLVVLLSMEVPLTGGEALRVQPVTVARVTATSVSKVEVTIVLLASQDIICPIMDKTLMELATLSLDQLLQVRYMCRLL